MPNDCMKKVSNPISGEVGAAATSRRTPMVGTRSFKPHQRGGGCCSVDEVTHGDANVATFQTPSAGRWVLQPLQGA